MAQSPAQLTRRSVLGASAASAATLGLGLLDALPAAAQQPAASANSPAHVRYCLNFSTIDGQKLTIDQKIAIAAQAGYDGIEPWTREIDAYEKAGGTLSDLRKQIDDAGLTVEDGIGFAQWIVNDDSQRKAGLEQAKRDMDKLARIGGKRMAAPPVGAHGEGGVSLDQAAARYRALLELGTTMGVTPQLELWGFSKILSRLGEVAYVATEAGHPDAAILLDVYHIYKGGSDFNGLGVISGNVLQVIHMNDYPADPPRETISDADRVYPGQGIAPYKQIFMDLFANGFNGALSLELFNREYWKHDALTVAKRGLDAMRHSVQLALEN